MCAAKGGLEVVQCHLVGQIYSAEPDAHFSLFTTEQIVVTDAEVVEISALHPRRIVVIIFLSRLWNMNQPAVASICIPGKPDRLFLVAA